MFAVEQVERLARRLGTRDRGRVAQVELGVFVRDLRLYVPVLFERIAVVVVAYQKYLSDAVAHQRTVVDTSFRLVVSCFHGCCVMCYRLSLSSAPRSPAQKSSRR